MLNIPANPNRIAYQIINNTESPFKVIAETTDGYELLPGHTYFVADDCYLGPITIYSSEAEFVEY